MIALAMVLILGFVSYRIIAGAKTRNGFKTFFAGVVIFPLFLVNLASAGVLTYIS